MAAGDVYRHIIVFDDTNLGNVMTTHLDTVQLGATDPAVSGLATNFKIMWDAGYTPLPPLKSFYKTTTRLVRVEMRKIKPLEEIVTSWDTDLPIAGTSTTDQLAPQISVLVSLRTALIGRRNRGRVYLPSPTETMELASGAMSSSDAQTVADLFSTMMDNIQTAGVQAVTVYSAANNDDNVVTSVKVDQRFRQQRKRAIESPLYSTSTVT